MNCINPGPVDTGYADDGAACLRLAAAPAQVLPQEQVRTGLLERLGRTRMGGQGCLVVLLGLVAAEQWGLQAPQFVKDEMEYWVTYIQNTNNKVQISVSQWYQDYPAASNFLNVLFGCGSLS